MYTTIRSALDEWKASRTALAAAVQSYRDACIALCVKSSTPVHQTHEHAMLEHLFLTINSELSSLEAEERTLYGLRLVVASMRNTSTTLVRTNTLPPEILANVFMLSKACCSHSDDTKGDPQNFAGVCRYWRQTALNTPGLWAHVDIGPGTSLDLANVLLERSKQAPVFLHLCELKANESTTKPRVLMVIKVLRSHLHRVQDLKLEFNSVSRNFIDTVLVMWLSSGDPRIARSLTILRPHAQSLLVYDGWDNITENESRNTKEMLQCLTMLRLQHTRLDWNCAVYSGLVDLRLSSPRTPMTISVSQLGRILALNPALQTLKLNSLKVIREEGWSCPPPILLRGLRCFCLFQIDHNSLELILPLIGLPHPCPELSVGLTTANPIPNIVKQFLVHSTATSLYCYDRSTDKSLSHTLLPTLHSMTYLHSLVLEKFQFCNVLLISENETLAPPFTPAIVLQSCTVTLKGLGGFVHNYGIQDLRLERCREPGGGKELEHIRESLLDACSGLRCSVSDISSTLRHTHCNRDM